MVMLTNRQARQFLLLKHGLLDPYKFIGKAGALEFVRQCGCIQFDPVDACGKNAELVLQSRVKGCTKKMLSDLLYKERALFDFPDKQLAILPIEDWPYFARWRKIAAEKANEFPEMQSHIEWTKEYIHEHGPVSAEELPLKGKLYWHSAIHWSGNWSGQSNAARSVLEQLYTTGELVIHHKVGARKVYDLSERHIPEKLRLAADPIPDALEHNKWRVLRRIGAVGLLWNKPSDAWLNIWDLKPANRQEIFRQLEAEGKIIPVRVEGLRDVLYCRSEDAALLEEVQKDNTYRPRCEVMAPLDCILWDRKLIRALFGFEYSWEIYTPQEKRKFGYYVLPMVYGERFAGRVEAVRDEKTSTLIVKHVWFEDGVKQTKALQNAAENCLKRLMKFNLCSNIRYE